MWTSAVLFALVLSFISPSLKILCDCRLTFPSEDLYNEDNESTTSSSLKGFHGFNNFNEINDSDSNKWAWRSWSPNGFAYQDGAWKWTPMSERTLKFPDSDEVSTAQKKTDDSSPPRWPRTSSLYKNFHTGEKTNHHQQLHYAHKYAHSPSHVVRLSSSYQTAVLPQKLQNYYKTYYGNSNGNANTPIQSGSEFEPVAFTPPAPFGWDPDGHDPSLPDVYGQHVYPKHIYYGRPRAETEGTKKKFSLEIHPAYLVAPLAGLATFGLVSKIVKTPVLLELGLVEKDKEKESEDEDAKVHNHQHQHEHHHHKFPHGVPGPGIIGLWPIPYPQYPSASASAVSSASSSSSSSSSSGSSPMQESMNSFISATQIPIILGPMTPTTPSTPALSAADPRPWWSSFAAMIPRLRLGDTERDR